MPLNSARGPSCLSIFLKHFMELCSLGFACILTLIVSKGYPITMPIILATEDAIMVFDKVLTDVVLLCFWVCILGIWNNFIKKFSLLLG